MAERPWKKKGKDFDFLFDFGNIEEMFDEFFKDLESENFSGKPLVMGFNVKVGPDGQPIIERFGNIKAAEGRPVVADAREPLVDVTKSQGEITITAELPGVEKKDIQASALDNKTVEIKVSGERPFYKRVELSEPIKPGSAKAKFKNGILEVAFQKQKPGKPVEKKGIKIE